MKRTNSLSKKKEINLVFKNGKRFNGKFFSVKFIKNNLNHWRLVIIVSNKISNKAVLRNKIRRRVKEALRAKLKKEIGYDMALVAKSDILNAEFKEIERDIALFIEEL